MTVTASTKMSASRQDSASDVADEVMVPSTPLDTRCQWLSWKTMPVAMPRGPSVVDHSRITTLKAEKLLPTSSVVAVWSTSSTGLGFRRRGLRGFGPGGGGGGGGGGSGGSSPPPATPTSEFRASSSWLSFAAIATARMTLPRRDAFRFCSLNAVGIEWRPE